MSGYWSFGHGTSQHTAPPCATPHLAHFCSLLPSAAELAAHIADGRCVDAHQVCGDGTTNMSLMRSCAVDISCGPDDAHGDTHVGADIIAAPQRNETDVATLCESATAAACVQLDDECARDTTTDDLVRHVQRQWWKSLTEQQGSTLHHTPTARNAALAEAVCVSALLCGDVECTASAEHDTADAQRAHLVPDTITTHVERTCELSGRVVCEDDKFTQSRRQFARSLRGRATCTHGSERTAATARRRQYATRDCTASMLRRDVTKQAAASPSRAMMTTHTCEDERCQRVASVDVAVAVHQDDNTQLLPHVPMQQQLVAMAQRIQASLAQLMPANDVRRRRFRDDLCCVADIHRAVHLAQQGLRRWRQRCTDAQHS